MRPVMILLLLLLTTAIAGWPAGAANHEPLAAAIRDLASTFPQTYTNAEGYLGRLAAVRDQEQFAALQREALLKNPLVTAQPILFVRRAQYINTHGPDETGVLPKSRFGFSI